LYVVTDVSENFIETNLTALQGHLMMRTEEQSSSGVSVNIFNIFKTTELRKFH